MTVTTVVVLVHPLIAILFVAGLVGRWMMLAAAARATDLAAMRALSAEHRADDHDPFERTRGTSRSSSFRVAACSSGLHTPTSSAP
jgi:hypothetical protein